jgi:hypothetical protein
MNANFFKDIGKTLVSIGSSLLDSLLLDEEEKKDQLMEDDSKNVIGDVFSYVPEYPGDFSFGSQVFTDPYEALFDFRPVRWLIRYFTQDQTYEYPKWTALNWWLSP